ncbi:transcription factor IIIB 90 kDa subunit-like [Ruditapes philippinarum]|uniref:transcription factor IIIB 90 kDa subunit-like n=1 Tax=Ruditapes philippinarum TaxID=129788 RepID=UPI00295C01CD|nr:transcription factor IIIB 90 kDa subunit-like [Ruditapes philippinarum]
MSSRMCNQCGCTDIDIDSTRGDAVCTGCGSVLEDQIIVSEVQFQENSGGGSSLIGQFVSSEGPGKSFSIGGSFPHGMQKESRTVTLQNGKKRIQQLASQMNLNQHCIDTAFNFFKMAVSKRMTRGRKTSNVIAACLYLVCRSERTPHMLLDFSDALQVNVYSLGRTYLHLSRELCINLPDIDPALYISRFAHNLEFGEKTHEVSMTAMRLVQRMKRDWMSTGRRPSGLCGAALLVAARIHDFSRSIKEIIKVVKVCQSTLRKRLVEFEETPSSQLTIEEFQTIDLEQEADPPSFTEGKRRAKKIQEQSKLPEYASEVSKLQEEIEQTLLNQKPRGIWAHYAKMADDCGSVDSEASRLSDLTESEESINEAKRNSSLDSLSDLSTGKNEIIKSESPQEPKTENSTQEVFDSGGPKLENSTQEVFDSGGTKNSETDDLQSDDLVETSKLTADTIGNELVIGSDLNVLDDKNVKEVTGALGVPAIGTEMETLVSDCMKEGSENSRDSVVDEELDLTGIDDAEINKYLLADKEVLLKTRIWMAENAEFLEEMRLKEEKKAKEAEEEAKKPPEKRKKYTKRKRKAPMQEAATAQEAIQKIMQEKKISCKINYDVLNDLNVKSTLTTNSPVKGENSVLGSAQDNSALISRFRKPSVSLDFRPAETKPVVKKAKKADLAPPPMLPQMDEKSKVDVVVESGPVQYDQKDDVYDEEEAEDYFEEEEHHLSAARLFGNTGVEVEEYDYDMD